jgi:hypothetical protein
MPAIQWLLRNKSLLRETANLTIHADSAMELYQQQELDRLIGHFF